MSVRKLSVPRIQDLKAKYDAAASKKKDEPEKKTCKCGGSLMRGKDMCKGCFEKKQAKEEKKAEKDKKAEKKSKSNNVVLIDSLDSLLSQSADLEDIAEDFKEEARAIAEDIASLPEAVPDLVLEELSQIVDERKEGASPFADGKTPDFGEEAPPEEAPPEEAPPEEGKEGGEDEFDFGGPPEGGSEPGAEEGLPDFLKEESSSFVYLPRKVLAAWVHSVSPNKMSRSGVENSASGWTKVPSKEFLRWVTTMKSAKASVDKAAKSAAPSEEVVTIPKKVFASWVGELEKNAIIPQAEMDAWYRDLNSSIIIPKTVYSGWLTQLEDSIQMPKKVFSTLLEKIEDLGSLAGNEKYQVLKSSCLKAMKSFSADEFGEEVAPVVINISSPSPAQVQVSEVPGGDGSAVSDQALIPEEGLPEGPLVEEPLAEGGEGAAEELAEGESVAEEIAEGDEIPMEGPIGDGAETDEYEMPDDVTAELTRVLEQEASGTDLGDGFMSGDDEPKSKEVDEETEALVSQMEKTLDSAMSSGMKTLPVSKSSAPSTKQNCVVTLEEVLFPKK